MEQITVDAERIRKDLMDHFGTSPFQWNKIAVARVESATPEEVIELALD